MSVIKNLKNNNLIDGLVGEVYLNLFDANVEIVLEKNVDEEYAEKCVCHLNKLNGIVIDELCKRLGSYYEILIESLKKTSFYNEFVESIEKQLTDKIVDRKILKYIKPQTLVIEKLQDDILEYTLYCDCVWKQEHGLCIMFRGDKISYVGEPC